MAIFTYCHLSLTGSRAGNLYGMLDDEKAAVISLSDPLPLLFVQHNVDMAADMQNMHVNSPANCHPSQANDIAFKQLFSWAGEKM